MSLIVKPYDPQLLWQGAVSLQHTEGWTMPWRLLFEERELSPPDQLVAFARSYACGGAYCLPQRYRHPCRNR